MTESGSSDCKCTMEEKLARIGSKIDEVILTAEVAKKDLKLRLDEVEQKKSAVKVRSMRALAEVRHAMEKAHQELLDAWAAVCDGTERAAEELTGKHCEQTNKHPVPCETHRKPFGASTDADNIESVV